MVNRDIYLLCKSEEFHLDSGQEVSINLNLKKIPPLPCTKLYGQVLSNCNRIQGATVKILSMDFKPICHTETDNDGEFSFINTLIAGDYEIVVSAEDYLVSESRCISLKPLSPLYVTINLTPDKSAEKATVYGTVRNSENIPLPNARVNIYSDQNLEYPANVTITNADGEYLFTGLRPGKYVITALCYGYTLPQEITIEIFPKDIFCAELYLYKTVLEEKGTVSGVVLHQGHLVPYAQAALFHKESNGNCLIKIQKANSKGEYLFSNVKEGKYIVTAKSE